VLGPVFNRAIAAAAAVLICAEVLTAGLIDEPAIAAGTCAEVLVDELAIAAGTRGPAAATELCEV
jgi:hypothetical protein